MAGQAEVKYLDGDFRVVRPGAFVRCAVTGLPIPLGAIIARRSLDTAALARLKSTAALLGEGSGEAGLDTVLAEIELRAQVELAKIGMPQSGKSPV